MLDLQQLRRVKVGKPGNQVKIPDEPPLKAEDVIEFYSEKIDKDPKNILFLSKRVEAHIKVEDYSSALIDAMTIVSINKHYRKGYILASRACFCMGDVYAADKIINQLQKIQPVIPSVLTEEFTDLKTFLFLKTNIISNYETNNYSDTIGAIDDMLQVFKHETSRLVILKAKCQVLKGSFEIARSLLKPILAVEPGNLDAAYMNACSFYHEGEFTVAVEACEKILLIDPAFKPAKELRKKAKAFLDRLVLGQSLFKSKKFRKAVRLFKDAMAIDPNNRIASATLFHNRAVGLKNLRYYQQALEDFEASFELNPDFKSIYHRKAECLFFLKKYPECQKECEEALKVGGSTDVGKVEKLMKKASDKMAQNGRKNFSSSLLSLFRT